MDPKHDSDTRRPLVGGIDSLLVGGAAALGWGLFCLITPRTMPAFVTDLDRTFDTALGVMLAALAMVIVGTLVGTFYDWWVYETSRRARAGAVRSAALFATIVLVSLLVSGLLAAFAPEPGQVDASVVPLFLGMVFTLAGLVGGVAWLLVKSGTRIAALGWRQMRSNW